MWQLERERARLASALSLSLTLSRTLSLSLAHTHTLSRALPQLEKERARLASAEKQLRLEWARMDQVSIYRESFIDNLLVRIHFIIVMIRWTGLAPWEFESPFPGSLTSTFLEVCITYIHPPPAHHAKQLRLEWARMDQV